MTENPETITGTPLISQKLSNDTRLKTRISLEKDWYNLLPKTLISLEKDW